MYSGYHGRRVLPLYRAGPGPGPALQPIRVQELSAEETLQVVSSLRDELRISRKVRVSDYVLRWLVYFAQQFIKNRHFPDKAVDLLSMVK